ncbi:MAG: hypothetical protein Ct9H90mP13_08910 [Pseudomonadota bacterium]|nr:MAG: hypothetical protein Ct9H90mP13_08910 [Pseudomonadota bacterium]
MNTDLKIYIPKKQLPTQWVQMTLFQKISSLKDIDKVKIIRNGSWGAFWLEPFIEVEKDGQRIGASFKGTDISHCITIDDFMIEFENKSPFDIRDIEFIKKQKRIVFSRIGLGDPLDLSLYPKKWRLPFTEKSPEP